MTEFAARNACLNSHRILLPQFYCWINRYKFTSHFPLQITLVRFKNRIRLSVYIFWLRCVYQNTLSRNIKRILMLFFFLICCSCCCWYWVWTYDTFISMHKYSEEFNACEGQHRHTKIKAFLIDIILSSQKLSDFIFERNVFTNWS